MQKFISILLFITPLYSNAYEIELARVNMGDDLANCASFYSLSSQFAAKSEVVNPGKGWASVAKTSEQSSLFAIQLLSALLPSRTDAQLIATMDRHMQANSKILYQEGMDRLQTLYLDSCKEILENPSDRMNYWIAKK